MRVSNKQFISQYILASCLDIQDALAELMEVQRRIQSWHFVPADLKIVDGMIVSELAGISLPSNSTAVELLKLLDLLD